jgi:hypothetical protein
MVVLRTFLCIEMAKASFVALSWPANAMEAKGA